MSTTCTCTSLVRSDVITSVTSSPAFTSIVPGAGVTLVPFTEMGIDVPPPVAVSAVADASPPPVVTAPDEAAAAGVVLLAVVLLAVVLLAVPPQAASTRAGGRITRPATRARRAAGNTGRPP